MIFSVVQLKIAQISNWQTYNKNYSAAHNEQTYKFGARVFSYYLFEFPQRDFWSFN